VLFKVKTGPFAEHSNQLYNISGVPSWSKVNSGLIKMYKAEVRALHLFAVILIEICITSAHFMHIQFPYYSVFL